MTVARESVTRTLSIAVAVALVCSAMVSAAVYVLRPIQGAYALIERNRAIVSASCERTDLSDGAVVQAFLDFDARVLDLDTNRLVSQFNGHSYDHWAEQPNADGRAGRLVPVYFVRPTGARAYLVLPVDGRGMWSTVYGYVALESDLNTVACVSFYRHGETPGIGDRIQNPAWLGSWQGKRIYDDAGAVQIRVARSDSAGGPHQVDVISGASVTSEAVGRFVNQWFGDDGYGPWLAQTRQTPAGMPSDER